MQKHIKSLLKDNLITIAILLTLGIAIVSLIKIGRQPIQINNFDKVAHACAYFILTFFWLIALKGMKINAIFVVLCCFFYGIIIEALQVTITSYRSGEFLDVIANSTGILIAYTVFFLFFRKNKAI